MINVTQAPSAQPADVDADLFGLEAWANFLEHKPLPVRVSVQARLRRLLKNDNTTLHQLTQLARMDPVLSLHLTRLAQQKHRAKGSEVTGIEHAVASLGLDPLEALCNTLETLKVNPHSVQQKMYFRAISDSQHASLQAAELCRQRGLPFVEEVRLAALLYGFAHWMLWLHAPLHKHLYQKRVLEDGIDVALAEQDLFGCTVQALGAELAQRWDLPNLTYQALDHGTSPSHQDLTLLHRRAVKDPRLGQLETREINQLTQQRFFPVKLGNWLALTTTRSWYSKKAARLFDVLADYLNTDSNKLLGQLHANCAEASRQFHVPGTLCPATEMLFIPSAHQAQGLLSEKEIERLARVAPKPIKPKPPQPEQDPVKEAPPVTEHLHPHIYEQVLERFQSGFEGYTKPAQILQALVQGLYQGLGLARLNIMVIKGSHTESLRNLGFPAEHPMCSLDINLEVPSLFKRLSEKPAGIWLNVQKRSTLTPMLPESFNQALGDHDCLLMSVFRGEKPLAILYADDLPNHTELSEYQYEQFRQLCAAATLALKRLPG